VPDPFAPPDPEPVTRAKPQFCRAYGPRGERCHLYWGHEAAFHKDDTARWLTEDEYL
jgi:hypothetical protein